MITLALDCLIFKLENGESIPFSPDMLTSEMLGNAAEAFDEEFVRHAAHAVFHFFKRDQGRQTVSLAEFAEALEKALRGFKHAESSAPAPASEAGIGELDLARLAAESAEGLELFFFPRLREELRRQLEKAPRVMRFRDLRGCVKRLAGARRWSGRCRNLEERIVVFLRECLGAERAKGEFALLVE